LGTLYVEDSRAAERNEVFRISNDHHEEQGSLESSWHFERSRQPFGNARRTRASVGVSLVVSLARGKKCFGAVVISNHSLNRMANQNLRNFAQKILRKMNLQLGQGTMTRKTIDDGSGRGDITWNSNPRDRTLPGAENQSRENNMMA
jgi:hypothetical protein